MANFDTIKTAIDANINTNGNQAITGAVMNSILKQMVDSTDAELTESERALSEMISENKNETDTKLTELEKYKADVNISPNIAIFDTIGYVSIQGKIAVDEAYRTSQWIWLENGQSLIVSARSSFVRLYAGSDQTPTTEGGSRIAYINAFVSTIDSRNYLKYTAQSDCWVLVSFYKSETEKMVEISDNDIPSPYEPYYKKLDDSIDVAFANSSECLTKEGESKLKKSLSNEFAHIDSSYNICNFVESGYVSIQNIMIDASTNGYKTSDWIELKKGESIIFSSEKSFCRCYFGENKNPTTEGGTRIDYLTAFTDSVDGINYVKYTATRDGYLRVSALNSSLKAMVEISSENIPREFKEYGTKLDGNIIVEKAKIADGLSEQGKEAFHPSNWYGKNVLVIGDSLTAANVWQNKLHELLGMNVTTHAKGGIGFPAMLDGSPASTDDVSQANGELLPLSVTDVTGKDMIIIYGGYNHRGSAEGSKGDLYPTVNSVYGCLQYLINGIYALLKTANNLSCRVIVITPHCAGRYSYIPFTWWEEYPSGSGRTGETLVSAIIKCANDNSVACLDLFHTSGINQFTWDELSASNSAYDESGNVRDQLHLNASKGYPYLGTRISNWINSL